MNADNPLALAILHRQLPATLEGFFDGAGQAGNIEFVEVTPHNLVLGLGARLVAAAIAFHNTAGGLLVFGASDAELRESVQNHPFNLEVFDWVVTNWTAHRLAVVRATYPHPARPEDSIEIVLVPPRQGGPLLRLTQGFDRFPAGAVLVRTENTVVQATAWHFDLLCGAAPDPSSGPMLLRGLPPRPPEPWALVGRDGEMIDLLRWFTEGSTRRLFLDGPAGVGKTTLAAEFGRRLVEAGQGMVLAGGARLEHVLYLGGEDPAFEAWASAHGDLMGNRTAEQFAHILFLAGWFERAGPVGDAAWLEAQLRLFLAGSAGLIIVDDGEPVNEGLLIRVLSATRHNKLLYTSGRQSRAVSDQTLRLTGFTQDAEYAAFLGLCAARSGVLPAPAVDHPSIARWTGGVPRAMEAVVERRREAPHYADALRLFRRERTG